MKRLLLFDKSENNRKLYGREKEIKLLRDAYQRAKEGEGQQRILVGAASGCGKTALVREAFGKHGSSILLGSSQLEPQSKSHVPYAALAQCLSEICQRVVSLANNTADDTMIEGYQSALETAFDSDDLCLLAKLIPEIGELMPRKKGDPCSVDEDALLGDSSAEKEEEAPVNPETLQQLKFCLRLFVEVLAAQSTRVLVVFLDDIQWIDPSTLEQVKSILSNSDLINFVFVGTYREEEVSMDEDTDHILGKWISEEQKKLAAAASDVDTSNRADEIMKEPPPSTNNLHWDLVHLYLEDLTLEQLDSMLVDLLKVEQSSSTLELAEVVKKRTGGNVFHVLQLLDVMQDRNLFVYSQTTFRWTWDIEKIKRQTSLSEKTAVAVVALKMELLSEEERECLKICCCLGHTFDLKGLLLVFPAMVQGADPNKCLESLIEYAFLEELSDARFKFSHDKIYEAAQGLFGDDDGNAHEGNNSPTINDKAQIHLQIGQLLWEANGKATLEKKGENNMLFLCMDQLNQGRFALSKRTIPDESHEASILPLEMARLNLVAGKRAAALSAFVPSAAYLETGLALLNDNDDKQDAWKDHYGLSLQLHTTLAEVAFSGGQLDQKDRAVKEVIRFAAKDDKVPALLVQVKSLAADTSKTKELLEAARQALEVLGEPLPAKVTKADQKKLTKKTRQRLESTPNKQILGLPTVSDPKKAFAIQVLARSFVPLDRSIKEDSERAIVDYILWKAIALTFDNGLAPYSAIAFSLIALKLTAPKDMDLAHRCSTLAKELMNSDDRALRVTHVNIEFNLLFMRYWREPLSLLIDSAIQIHRTGLRLGDHWSGFSGILLYGMFYYYSGLPLGPLAKDLHKFSELMIDYGFHVSALWLLPCYQATLNLLGPVKNIVDLSSQTVTKSLRQRCGWKKGGGGEHSEWSFSMQIAFYCEEFEHASAMADKLKALKEDALPVAFTYQPRIFFFCLIACLRGRQTKKSSHRKEARKHFDVVNEWVVEGKSINMAHKLRILEAEMLLLDEYSVLKGINKKLNPLRNRASVTEQEAATQAKLREAYDRAIAASSRSGFLQDAALAAQLASRALPDYRDDYHEKAIRFYRTWGATGVVEHLTRKRRNSSSTIEDSAKSMNQDQSGYKSRERFDNSMVDEHKNLDTAMENNDMRRSVTTS